MNVMQGREKRRRLEDRDVALREEKSARSLERENILLSKTNYWTTELHTSRSIKKRKN